MSGATKTILQRYLDRESGLKEFQSRLESGDTENIGVARLRGCVTNSTHWLTTFQAPVKLIQNSLEVQRKNKDEIQLVKFRNIEEHTLLETMERQGPSIFYYAQRGFCLPADYVFLPSDFRKNKVTYMDALVFHPEFISDELLLSFGLISEEDVLPSFSKKSDDEKSQLLLKNLKKKISCIPVLKKILSGVQPLQTGNATTRRTGRINKLPQPHTGYIVFQEQKKDSGVINRPNILYSAKMYSDIYSLVRSQSYGKEGISEENIELQDIADRIDSLHLGWKMIVKGDKECEVKDLIEVLDKSRNPNMNRAKRRLMAIDYRHDEKDANRVLGAYNDIKRQIFTQEGKKGAIGFHTAILRGIIRSEETKFQFLNKQFLQGLEKLDHKMITQFLEGSPSLSDDVQEKITRIYKVLLGIVDGTHVAEFRGEPFSGFMEKLSTEVTSQKHTPSEIIRSLFRIILAIKYQSYKLFLYQAKHSLKLQQENEGALIKKSQLLIQFLSEKTFLPEIELTEKGSDKFRSMIESLEGLNTLMLTRRKKDIFRKLDELMNGL